MNKQVQPISDENISEMCIEEQIIARAKTNYRRLPMMEVLFEQLEAPLIHTLNTFISAKSEVTLKSFDYMSCADALEELSDPCLFGIAHAEPWAGLFGIVAEPELIFTMQQIMLGGRPSSPPKKPHSFTTIEKRISTKFYDVILRGLSQLFSDVTPVTFHIDELAEDLEDLELAPLDSACVKVKINILFEGQGGQVTFIMPYIAFEPANTAFSQPFRGGNISGETGWRSVIAKSLQGTDIELTAVMQELTIPLHKVLAWHPGHILDIGIDAEHELLVNCSDKQMFRAAMGCRKNGSVALRISETLNEMDG